MSCTRSAKWHDASFHTHTHKKPPNNNNNNHPSPAKKVNNLMSPFLISIRVKQGADSQLHGGVSWPGGPGAAPLQGGRGPPLSATHTSVCMHARTQRGGEGREEAGVS